MRSDITAGHFNVMLSTKACMSVVFACVCMLVKALGHFRGLYFYIFAFIRNINIFF